MAQTSLNSTGVASSGSLALQSNGTTAAMTIDSSQNVQIGTITAAAGGLLTLNKAPVAAFGNPIFQLGGSSFTSGGYYSIGMGFTDATYTEPPAEIAYVSTSDSGGTKGAIVFGNRDVTTNTAVTERVRIDSSGNLLVGTTSQIGVGRQSISYNQSTDRGLTLQNTNAANTGNYLGFYNSSGTLQGNIVQTNSTTTAYATSSDYRLKDNPQPMQNALATVTQLKPCTYTWKADGSAGQGFIAHELQEVVPDCVIGEKDAVDADGNPVYQGIDTSFLVATLTAAIQEQQALISSQAAAITTLTERVTALEA